jgi:hypothetical protein
MSRETVPVEFHEEEEEEDGSLFDPHLERSYDQVKNRIKELADIPWRKEECKDPTLQVESHTFGEQVDPKQLVKDHNLRISSHTW